MSVILQKRETAWAITVFFIIVSFLGGGARSLNREKSAAAEIFFGGSAGDGFGIQRELDHRINFSHNFITIANRYIQGNEAVKQVENAREALINSSDISDKSKNNLLLTEAVYILYNRLGDEELSEADARYRESLYADIRARNSIISNDSYNANAREFNRTLNVFPASIIRTLGIVKELPLF